MPYYRCHRVAEIQLAKESKDQSFAFQATVWLRARWMESGMMNGELLLELKHELEHIRGCDNVNACGSETACLDR